MHQGLETISIFPLLLSLQQHDTHCTMVHCIYVTQVTWELLYLNVNYIQNLSEHMTLPAATLDSFSGGERGWVYCAAAGTYNLLRGSEFI